MAEKYDDRNQQVQDPNINSDPISPIHNTTTDAGTDTNQTKDLGTKRAPLSRASTLTSIKEDDDSSLDEQQVLDSFKSIMDIFAKDLEEENELNGKVSSTETSVASKSASLSISEDADSLDEEVRQIMSKSEEKQKDLQEKDLVSQPEVKNLNNFEENKEKEVKEKEQIHEETGESSDYIDEDDDDDDDDADEDDDDDDTESLATDTESMSDSSSAEFMSNDERKGHWSLRESDESSDDEEFDIEAHINKLCRETMDSDSSSDAEGTDSETEQVRKKVMRMYFRKYGHDNHKEPESEDTESSDAESDSDDESRHEDSIEEVEIENDQSSVYSSSDGTDSDFLADDSVSISTASSINGDYNMEDDNEKETLQAVSEEIPYLSNPAMMPSHEKVYNHYLASRPESCPEKIEVQDGEIGQNIGLDNTLATRSVINLRWPFTSYYVKEFDLDSENPTYEEDALLPCYKSMKCSASFPGRRRNVMLGRVWWVEWWANDAVKDEQEEGEDRIKSAEKEENLEEVGDIGQFEREELDTRL